jgi:hypothetical protein
MRRKARTAEPRVARQPPARSRAASHRDVAFPPESRSRANIARLVLPAGGLVVAVLIVVLRHELLPAKFFYDSNHIQAIATSGVDPYSDHSYEAAAYVYRMLGLQREELVVGLLSLALAAVVVWSAMRAVRFRMTWTGSIVAALALLLSGVYLGTFSKDVFILPLALLVLKSRRPLALLWTVAGVALYAHIFRSYWWIVLGLAIVFHLTSIRLPRRIVAFAGPFLALVAIALATFVVLGAPSDAARITVNATRIGSADAATLIPQYLHIGEPWSALANTVLVLLGIVVPLPLALHGSTYYVAAAAVLLVIWLAFFRAVARADRLPAAAWRAAVLVIALLTTQALFEPDYGSVLRHLTPLLGLITFVVLASQQDDGSSDFGGPRRRQQIEPTRVPRSSGVERGRGFLWIRPRRAPDPAPTPKRASGPDVPRPVNDRRFEPTEH